MWVANSHIVNVPCPDGGRDVDGQGGSVALIRANGEVAAGTPFTGGGLPPALGHLGRRQRQCMGREFRQRPRHGGGSNLIRISQFCGMDTSKCPPGLRTGDPISPPTGYTSDALQRMTATEIDPSGNRLGHRQLEEVPIQNNPGGDAIVIFVGIAGPVKRR